MTNTNPTFLRRFQVFVAFGKNNPISESVTITLGFSGAVDPESGMILNLSEIDRWIQTFCVQISGKCFLNRWQFFKLAKIKFQKIIKGNEWDQIHCSFHDFFIKFIKNETFFGWYHVAKMKSSNQTWLSPVTLTMQLHSSNWPAVPRAQEGRIKNKLKSIVLKKKTMVGFGSIKGSGFHSFEFVDPLANVSVRIYGTTLK